MVLSSHFHHVQCEGLHTICFTCGRVGHGDVSCPETVHSYNATAIEQVEVATEDVSTGTGSSESPAFSPKKPAPLYGKWMLVQRRRRHNNGNSRNNANDHGIKTKYGVNSRVNKNHSIQGTGANTSQEISKAKNLRNKGAKGKEIMVGSTYNNSQN